MIHEANDNTPAIETVERQFEQWRSSRVKKCEPIPQHLWKAAAQLCKVQKPAPQFVELSASCLLGVNIFRVQDKV